MLVFLISRFPTTFGTSYQLLPPPYLLSWTPEVAMGIFNSCKDMGLGLFVPVILLVATRSLGLLAPGTTLQIYAKP